METWWRGKTVFITGATGAWGTEFVRQCLTLPVEKVVAFCRGEHRAHELSGTMGRYFSSSTMQKLRLLLGDIRDPERLHRALSGVSVLIHCAALKRVETGTYNPGEIFQTNITGTFNVVNAALDCQVSHCLFISSDKAVAPTTTYGATKMVGEELWLGGNVYAPAPAPPHFSVLRSGNVLGSTGSVLPIWRQQRDAGLPLTITDPAMTRFLIRLSDVVAYALACIPQMRGGELFFPPMKAATMGVLAEAFAPGYPTTIIGSRGHGEKHHEIIDLAAPSSQEAQQYTAEELRIILLQEGLI